MNVGTLSNASGHKRVPRLHDAAVAKIAAIGFALSTLGVNTTIAQEGAISAERPGFSLSPIALAPSVLQVEGGYQYTRDSGSVDADDHTLPLALLRVGLAERLELQLSWAGISRTEIDGRTFDGTNDAGIGVKWQLNDKDTTVPLAVFAGVSLPVGDDEFTSDEVEPTVGAFWTHSATIDWFGTVLLSEANDDIVASNAVGVGIPINTQTSSYVEYFGNYGGDDGPEHYLNGGFAYLPRLDLQLDLHVGAGLNNRAADFFLGFGLAYRF